MKKYCFLISQVCVFSILLAMISCKKANPNVSNLGSVEFNVIGAEEAQASFKKGLLMLHSFEYEDARENFLLAQQVDPDFVMAYWGEAMTYNHPLWSAQYYEEGKAALEKLGNSEEIRAQKANSEFEKEILRSVEILFGPGEKFDRDQIYADYMEKLFMKYPDHHEVAAFYALSLLGSAGEGRDVNIYGKGARIAQSILEENPNHPGALHYLIHSYDDPDHAHLALAAADSYSKVAMDAGHALHMPSHIYVALGMWEQVISSNIDAWEASLNRMQRKQLDNDARNYHALQWLMYGYLQVGANELARELVSDMVAYTETLPSKRARAYLVTMLAAYLTETNHWDDPLAEKEVDTEDLNISMQSIAVFQRGMKAFMGGDSALLENEINVMIDQRAESQKKILQRGASMCSGLGWASQLPIQLDIDHAHIMEMELMALLSILKKDSYQAELWFQKATALEDETSFTFGPPIVVKPSHELYGEWLLTQNQHEEAAIQFEKALKRAPKRLFSLNGLEATKSISM